MVRSMLSLLSPLIIRYNCEDLMTDYDFDAMPQREGSLVNSAQVRSIDMGGSLTPHLREISDA